MKADRMLAWLKKRARGATSLRVVAETLTGFAEVCVFEADEIKLMGAEPEDDIAQAIVEQCQEYTDGESTACKFALQWIGKDEKILRSTGHRCSPGEPEDEPLQRFPKAIDATEIIGSLLSTLTAERKAAASQVAVMSDAYAKIIELQSAQLSELHKDRLATARKVVPEVTAVVVTDEAREVSIQQAEAFKAFTALLPDAGQLLLAAISQRLLDPVEPVDEVAAARAAKAGDE